MFQKIWKYFSLSKLDSNRLFENHDENQNSQIKNDARHQQPGRTDTIDFLEVYDSSDQFLLEDNVIHI